MIKHVWLFSLLFCIKVCAQDSTAFKQLFTDRPGQSITPYTVGNKVIQLQGGYGYFADQNSFREIRIHNVDLNTRIGIGDRVEVSVLFQGSSLSFRSEELATNFFGDDDWNTGLTAFAMASRGLLMKGDGLKPAIGFEATYFISGFPGESLNSQQGRFILSLQNVLFDRLTFTGNVVYYTSNQTEFTANLGYSLTNRIGVFAEYWPILEAVFDGESNLVLQDSYLNLGLTWLWNEDLQLDMASGFRAFAPDFYRDDANSYYFQLGVTKRFWL